MSHLYDKSELTFQAFRYISEEMTSDEREQFEELLAASQEAREEVAVAVELSQAVALAQSHHELARPTAWATWSNRVRWMLVGTAACLAVVGMSKLLEPSGESIAERPSAAAQSLAVAWLDSQDLTDEAISSEDETDQDATATEPTVDDLTASEEVVVAEDVAVPGWLLAAVSSERVKAPEEARGALEN